MAHSSGPDVERGRLPNLGCFLVGDMLEYWLWWFGTCAVVEVVMDEGLDVCDKMFLGR